MKLDTFCTRLDDRLQTADFADIDGNANGLQVGPSDGRSIDHAAFAVDAAQATIDRAIDANADVLVTHHGLFWEGTDRLTGYSYDRVRSLITGELALYVAHLPLDSHQELGNAAGVGDILEIEDREPFAEYSGEYVGQQGRLDTPQTVDTIVETLSTELEGAESVHALPFGTEEVETVGIVTGAGVDYLEPAAIAGLDVLITGEGKQYVHHVARELEMNLVLAGHYATETTGVKALKSLVEEWGLETTYVSHPMRL